MAMIRRKYFIVTPRLRHNIVGLFKKFENCKNVGVLILVVVGIFFVSVFNWQYYFNIETKSQTFIDILHNIPVNKRRYFVWKEALETRNNRQKAVGCLNGSPCNLTRAQLINATINEYTVGIDYLIPCY